MNAAIAAGSAATTSPTVSLATALQQAAHFAESGDRDAALARYRDILTADPNNPLALRGAGRLVLLAGNTDSGAALLQRALVAAEAIAPDDKSFLAGLAADLGNAEYAAGRIDAAVIVWDKSLALDHDPAVEQWRTEAVSLLESVAGAATEVDAAGRSSAFAMLAAVASARDDHGRAVDYLEEALKAQPEARSWARALITALHKQSNHQRLIKVCRRTLKHHPDDVTTRIDLGRALRATGQIKDSSGEFHQALKVNPAHGEALIQFGTTLQELGRGSEITAVVKAAIKHVDALAIELRSDARRELGIALNELCFYDAAEQVFRAVLATDPQDAVAKAGLGFAYDARGQFGPASREYMEALAIDPLQERATIRFSHLLAKQGAYEASLYTSLSFLQHRPDNKLARIYSTLTLPMIYDGTEQLDAVRGRFITELDRLTAQPPQLDSRELSACFTNFELAYQGRNDVDLQRKTSQLFRLMSPSLNFSAPHVDKKTSKKRLRLGVVSAYLNGHTIAKLTQGYIEGLPRDEFEILLVRPAYARDDAWSSRLDRAAAGAISLPADINAAQRLLASLEFDILFYPDIGMDNTTYFLAHARLARLQTVTWGHPVTTGIDTIDSFVSSTHLETANASTHYSEPLVQLRDLPVCYYQPDEGAPLDRISMGLAPSARLYGCPQSLFKYHPAFDAVLAGILRADKRAIILGIDGSHPTWGRLLRARLERNMPDVHHRVKFIPHVPNEKFTALLKMMDVLLDPLHFGGGNTSLEGFAAGVPIVTWPGEFMRSRVTVGAYRQMGFTDLVVDGAQRYVDTAIKVANDKPYRAQCIEAIRAGAPRLINHRPAVTEFAQYLRSAYAGR